MKYLPLYLLLTIPVIGYGTDLPKKLEVLEAKTVNEAEESIYEVTANNSWKYPTIIVFEGDKIFMPISYLPSDMLGNLLPEGLVERGSEKFLILDKMTITKRDDENSTLSFDIPIEYLKDQNLDFKKQQKESSQPINAFYSNYDINFTNYGFKSTKAAFSMNYASKDNWIFKNEFLWNGTEVVRLQSIWQKQNKDNSAWFAGDVRSTSMSGFNGLNVLGLRYSTPYFNNARYIQDSLPLLPLSGYSINPSKLDLYINNQLIQQTEVAAGRYNLNVPFQSNGLGVAQTYTYDIVGRPVVVDVPFYNTNQVLRQGVAEYDVSAGFVRKDFGTQSFSYGIPALQGILKYGVANNYTQDFYLQSSTLYSAASVLSHWVPHPQIGVINFGASLNSNKESLLRVGYDRASNGFSFGGDMQKSSQFCMGYNQTCLKTQSQIYASAALPKGWGSINANYISRETTTDKNNIMRLGWSTRLSRAMNLTASISKSTGSFNNTTAYIGLTYNLDNNISSNTNINRNNGENSYQQNLSFSEDSKNPQRGYGSATFNQSNGSTSSNLFYGNHLNMLDYQFNYYRNNNVNSGNLSVSGGMSYIPEANYFSLNRRSNGGLAYVEIQGTTEPIEIMHQNKPYGYTNNKGQIVVADIIPDNTESIEIDMNKLSTNFSLEEYRKTTYIPFSGAVKLDFKVKQLPYIITIIGAKSGSLFSIGSNDYVVGEGGEAAVDISGKAQIRINGKLCEIDIKPTQERYTCD